MSYLTPEMNQRITAEHPGWSMDEARRVVNARPTAYVIGSDGLIYTGRDAVEIAKDNNQDWNPAVNYGV